MEIMSGKGRTKKVKEECMKKQMQEREKKRAENAKSKKYYWEKESYERER